MPVLNKEQKVYIVRALAQFDTPTIVIRKVKEMYGIDLPTAQIAKYDPTTHAGRTLSASMVSIFEAARKKYLECEQNLGIANRTHRLALCEEAANIARERGDTKGMLRAAAEAERIAGSYWTKDKNAGGGTGQVIVFNAPQVVDGVAAAAADSEDCNQLQSPGEAPGAGDA